MIALDAETAVRLCEILLGLGLIQQTAENWLLRAHFSSAGQWSWAITGSNSPSFIRPFFSLIFADGFFQFLLCLQFCVAGGLIFFPTKAVIASNLLLAMIRSVRFRGAFNGGSCYMTFALLLGLFLGSAIIPAASTSQAAGNALIIIAVQCTLSYVVSGWSKARVRGWRDGTQLRAILTGTSYPVPPVLRRFCADHRSGPILRSASYAVLIFECLFPLMFFSPVSCLVFMAIAMVFHLAMALIFALNRFWLVWLACDPALYWASTHWRN